MTTPAEPLRQLPFTPRPFRRETISSYLTRLASANRIRIWHMLQLTAISAQQQRGFTPATDDWLGWSPSTPHRIAALAGRQLAALTAAFPAVAGFLADPARPPAPHAGKIQSDDGGIEELPLLREAARSIRATRSPARPAALAAPRSPHPGQHTTRNPGPAAATRT